MKSPKSRHFLTTTRVFVSQSAIRVRFSPLAKSAHDEKTSNTMFSSSTKSLQHETLPFPSTRLWPRVLKHSFCVFHLVHQTCTKRKHHFRVGLFVGSEPIKAFAVIPCVCLWYTHTLCAISHYVPYMNARWHTLRSSEGNTGNETDELRSGC